MIGDSLRSDVFGALRSGMDGCWFNWRGEENTRGILPTYTIADLTELSRFL
jgi:FMN phosphatase YigB (HAD superfamily)